MSAAPQPDNNNKEPASETKVSADVFFDITNKRQRLPASQNQVQRNRPRSLQRDRANRRNKENDMRIRPLLEGSTNRSELARIRQDLAYLRRENEALKVKHLEAAKEIACLRRAIENHKPGNSQDWLKAAESGDLEQLKVLLHNGANCNTKNSRPGYYSDWTALHFCAERNFFRTAQYLLENTATRIDDRNDCGQTPLMEACRWGRKDLVRIFVKHNADVNAKNCWGETPLIVAVINGDDNDELVRVLVESPRFTSLNRHDDADKTALRHLLDKPKSDATERLISYLKFKGATA